MTIHHYDYLQENLAWLRCKQIFSWTVGAPHSLLHRLVSKCTVPAATMIPMGEFQGDERFVATQISFSAEWKTAHALELRNGHALNSRRWVVIAQGNGCNFEAADQWLPLLEKLEAHAVVLGYSSLTRRSLLVKAYRQALLHCETMGDEIVLLGQSLGGGVMGEAAAAHRFHPQKRYVAFFERTFTTLSKAARRIIERETCSCLGVLAAWGAAFAGWNLDARKGNANFQREGISQHVIVARQDQVIIGDARFDGEKIRGATIHTFHNADHMDPVDYADVVERVATDLGKERVTRSKQSPLRVALFAIALLIAAEAVVSGGVALRYPTLPGGLGGGWPSTALILYGVAVALFSTVVFFISKARVEKEGHLV